MYFDFRLCNDVSTKQNSNNKNVTQAESIRVVPRSPLKRDLISHPTLQGMAFLFTIMFFLSLSLETWIFYVLQMRR